MKHFLLSMFILISNCIHSSENIYENALNYFIKKINDGVGMNYTQYTSDSILRFEQNDIFLEKNFSEYVQGYKIIKLESVKKYIDTCSNPCLTIFTIDKIDYCETCDAPFLISIKEYNIIKKENKFSFCNWTLYDICYTYNCRKKKFKYKKMGAYGSIEMSLKELEKKGWID